MKTILSLGLVLALASTALAQKQLTPLQAPTQAPPVSVPTKQAYAEPELRLSAPAPVYAPAPVLSTVSVPVTRLQTTTVPVTTLVPQTTLQTIQTPVTEFQQVTMAASAPVSLPVSAVSVNAKSGCKLFKCLHRNAASTATLQTTATVQAVPVTTRSVTRTRTVVRGG